MDITNMYPSRQTISDPSNKAQSQDPFEKFHSSSSDPISEPSCQGTLRGNECLASSARPKSPPRTEAKEGRMLHSGCFCLTMTLVCGSDVPESLDRVPRNFFVFCYFSGAVLKTALGIIYKQYSRNS